MTEEMNIAPPRIEALTDDLRAAEADVAAFFGGLSIENLTLRAGDAWTAAEHLAHLNTAVSAVARGLAMPRWILRIRFGRNRKSRRTYQQLVDDYRGRLAGGGMASGEFIPAREDGPTENATRRRHELLSRWERVNTRLRNALKQWNESDLDRIRLPHPLLGTISAREMVYFTMYHNRHHIISASVRLPS